MSKIIQTITEPPLREVLRVGQRAFGYLNPDVDKNYLETIGIGFCIGVYVKNSSRGLQGLAHLDGPDYRGQVGQFLRYLRARNLTDDNYSQVQVLRSQQSVREGVEDICSALKLWGLRNIEVVDGGWPVDAIFNRNGEMYWVDPETIKNEMTEDELRLWVLSTLVRGGLKCENTGIVVEPRTIPPHGSSSSEGEIDRKVYGRVSLCRKGKNTAILGVWDPEGRKLEARIVFSFIPELEESVPSGFVDLYTGRQLNDIVDEVSGDLTALVGENPEVEEWLKGAGIRKSIYPPTEC